MTNQNINALRQCSKIKKIPTKYCMCPNQYVLFNVYIVSNIPTKEELAAPEINTTL